jgi:hypothetical protein
MQRGTRQPPSQLIASLCGVTDLHRKMPSNAFFTMFGILVSWLERTPNRSDCAVECAVDIQCVMSSAALTLRSWLRIPLGAWVRFLSCVGRDLQTGRSPSKVFH